MSSIHNFHRDFLWRVAGFPCEDLLQFGLNGLAEQITAIFSASSADDWASWWNRHERLLLESRLSETFQSEFYALRKRLGATVRQPRFQAAVAYSSPTAATRLRGFFSNPPTVRNSKSKRRELLAMRYLQRFVTKCETAAFIGPTATGRITYVEERVRCRLDLACYSPTLFLSTQVLTAFARHLRLDACVLSRLRVHRASATALLGGSAVAHPSLGVINLRAECIDVLRAAAQPTPVDELRLSLPMPSAELLPVVFALLWCGLLIDELDSLPQSASPLPVLERLVSDVGAERTPEASVLRMLSEALTTWGEAGAVRRQVLLDTIAKGVSIAGIQLPAREEQFYADGLPVVEDGICHASSLTLDEELIAPLLAQLESSLRRSLHRPLPAGLSEVSGRLIREHGGRGLLAPMLGWSEVSDLGVTKSAVEPQADATAGSHVITSPDVMIAATSVEAVCRGELTLVLAESHSFVGCAGFPTRVLPDSRRWLESVSDFLRTQLAPAIPMVVTAPMTNKTSYLGPLPGIQYLEVGSPAPLGSDIARLDDLEVVSEGDQLRLVDRTTDRRFALVPNGPVRRRFGLLDVFRPPAYAPHRPPGPRRVQDRIVEKRASWVLRLDDGPHSGAGPFETFVWAQSVRVRYGLPRWVFIHPADERKPICIDLANPFLCEELLRHGRRHPSLEVTEMLPDPTQAWVTGPDGHHLSELRLLYAAAS